MRQNERMQDAFGTVILVVCGVSLVIAFVAFATSGRAWREFGRNGLVLDHDLPRSFSGSAGSIQERDAEIRELLHARNARRIRRGEAPIDVERELARLTAPMVDPELRQEIRDLVIARNNRRVRAGKPALDVEAEIEREVGRLTEL
jgi:hypothetical protein